MNERLRQIQPHFMTNLERAQRHIPKNTWLENDVGINVVFSPTDKDLPARFLAGLVPAAVITEGIRDWKHINPTIRVFIPFHLAIHCNQIPEVQARTQVDLGLLVVQKFQHIFHPEIQLFADIDKPLTLEALSLLTDLSERLLQQADSSLESEWQKVFASASRRGVEATAKLYAPHHLFGWQDAWQGDLFFPAQPKRITINCISQAETPYQRLRSEFLKVAQGEQPHLLVHGEHVDLVTQACHRPHYLPVAVGSQVEPTLADLLIVGFAKVRQELERLTVRNPGNAKFRNALSDLITVEAHVTSCQSSHNKLPNAQEFFEEINHATE